VTNLFRGPGGQKSRAKESINYIISCITQKAGTCAEHVPNQNLVCQLVEKNFVSREENFIPVLIVKLSNVGN